MALLTNFITIDGNTISDTAIRLLTPVSTGTLSYGTVAAQW